MPRSDTFHPGMTDTVLPSAARTASGNTAPLGGWALPKTLTAAILLMTGDLYAFRETGVVGTIGADIKMTVSAERLLTPWRIWRI